MAPDLNRQPVQVPQDRPWSDPVYEIKSRAHSLVLSLIIHLLFLRVCVCVTVCRLTLEKVQPASLVVSAASGLLACHVNSVSYRGDRVLACLSVLTWHCNCRAAGIDLVWLTQLFFFPPNHVSESFLFIAQRFFCALQLQRTRGLFYSPLLHSAHLLLCRDEEVKSHLSLT